MVMALPLRYSIQENTQCKGHILVFIMRTNFVLIVSRNLNAGKSKFVTFKPSKIDFYV